MNQLTNRLPKSKRSVNRWLSDRLETLITIDKYVTFFAKKAWKRVGWILPRCHDGSLFYWRHGVQNARCITRFFNATVLDSVFHDVTYSSVNLWNRLYCIKTPTYPIPCPTLAHWAKCLKFATFWLYNEAFKCHKKSIILTSVSQEQSAKRNKQQFLSQQPIILWALSSIIFLQFYSVNLHMNSSRICFDKKTEEKCVITQKF